MRFLPIGVPYHSPYLSTCTSTTMATDVDSSIKSFWERSKLLIPVYNIENGRDLRTDEPNAGDSLVQELIEQVFSSPIHWKKATRFNDDATHVVDFGTGGISGIGSLTARESEGKGLRVVIASAGTNGRGIEEVYSATKLRVDSKWMDKFGPKLVKTAADGQVWLDTKMSRLLSKPPLMVAGMTPCTVGAGFNAAVANAGESSFARCCRNSAKMCADAPICTRQAITSSWLEAATTTPRRFAARSPTSPRATPARASASPSTPSISTRGSSPSSSRSGSR